MEKKFPGYYRPTEEQFKSLWDDCYFVLDANVLLNLYRYTPDTSEQLVNILNQISTRLWIPHQSAFEFQKNRLIVIEQQRRVYTALEKEINKTKNNLESLFKRYKRHPYIEINEIIESTNYFFTKVIDDLSVMKNSHPDLRESDDIRERIDHLFEGKIGDPYDLTKQKELIVEAKKRYSEEIPPGYKDEDDKEGTKKYGDFILWYQIIDFASEQKKPIILVTDDRKEDWWWILNGNTIAPRPELISEILEKAGVNLYMYNSDQFLEFAKDYLKQEIDQGAIDEIKNLREAYKTEKYLRKKIVDIQELQNHRNFIQDQINNISKQIEKLTDLDSDILSKDGLDEQEMHSLLDRFNKLVAEKMLLDKDIARIDNLIKEIRNELVHSPLSQSYSTGTYPNLNDER